MVTSTRRVTPPAACRIRFLFLGAGSRTMSTATPVTYADRKGGGPKAHHGTRCPVASPSSSEGRSVPNPGHKRNHRHDRQLTSRHPTVRRWPSTAGNERHCPQANTVVFPYETATRADSRGRVTDPETHGTGGARAPDPDCAERARASPRPAAPIADRPRWPGAPHRSSAGHTEP